MQSFSRLQIGLLLNLILISGSVCPAYARVSKSIEEQYKQEYENKALFLKIPIYSEEQVIRIERQTYRVVPGLGSPLHKVGEQLRIVNIDFDRDEIIFRLSATASQGEAEIIFRFNSDLQETFPNRDIFDRALEATFTAGLKFSDIEDAKKTYLEGEFERSVGQMAGAASLSSEFVLETIAPLIPNYRETQLERDSLKDMVDEISAELMRLQTENRDLESKFNEQSSRLSRLESTNTSLEEKIKGSESETLQLDKELQDANRKIQRFEEEIANIQNSLDMEADTNRDLTQNNA